jgi:hypothetical protein
MAIVLERVNIAPTLTITAKIAFKSQIRKREAKIIY